MMVEICVYDPISSLLTDPFKVVSFVRFSVFSYNGFTIFFADFVRLPSIKCNRKIGGSRFIDCLLQCL